MHRRRCAAERLSKAYGDRRALQDVSFAAAAGRADRDHRAERRGQDDAAADPRRRARADGRDRLARPPRGRLGAAAAGDLLEALRAREPAPVRAARAGRRRRRDRRAHARPDRAGRPRRRRGRHALGRQPAAGQHRRRPARRPGRAAARRAVLVARPAPARAAVGVRRRPGRAAARRSSTRPTTSPRPSATPTGCSCSPTASCCSRARPPSSSARRASTTRSTSRARSCASCAAGGTDACAGCCSRTCRSCAARRCWWRCWSSTRWSSRCSSAPRCRRGRRSRRSRSPTSCRPGEARIDVGGERLDATTYAGRAVRERRRRSASTRARRRSPRSSRARRSARSSSRADVIERLQATLSLGGGDPPTVEVYFSAENPLKRRYVEATIDATLADANKALVGRDLQGGGGLPEPDRHGRVDLAAGRSATWTSSACATRSGSSTPRSPACRPTPRRAPRSSRCRASPSSPPTTSTSPSRSSPRSPTRSRSKETALVGLGRRARRVRRRGRRAHLADVRRRCCSPPACSRSSARSTRSAGSCAGWSPAPALLAEKIGLAALCAWALAAVMLAVLVAFLDLGWSRTPAWLLALAVAALAFAALGVAIGGLAREVRAASLLAFMLALPIAALALVPSGAVGGTLYDADPDRLGRVPVQAGARRARRGAERRRPARARCCTSPR